MSLTYKIRPDDYPTFADRVTEKLMHVSVPGFIGMVDAWRTSGNKPGVTDPQEARQLARSFVGFASKWKRPLVRRLNRRYL